jgi:hypothetical protein
MKKSILNLGKTLSKADQKQINGGLTVPRKKDYCDQYVTEITYSKCQCTYLGNC